MANSLQGLDLSKCTSIRDTVKLAMDFMDVEGHPFEDAVVVAHQILEIACIDVKSDWFDWVLDIAGRPFPKCLYHYTPPQNLQSILTHGLQASKFFRGPALLDEQEKLTEESFANYHAINKYIWLSEICYVAIPRKGEEFGKLRLTHDGPVLRLELDTKRISGIRRSTPGHIYVTEDAVHPSAITSIETINLRYYLEHTAYK